MNDGCSRSIDSLCHSFNKVCNRINNVFFQNNKLILIILSVERWWHVPMNTCTPIGTFLLEKAYDRVPRSEVWNCLRLKGVAEKYIRVIQGMYRDSRTKVKCTAGLTDCGAPSALSPLLFAIVMDCLTRGIQRDAP